ncbi:hypothetical protein [Halomonas sp. LBP4]|uniref:hypothetical protein n=1 Tax=Halomonas sp. LBP4 TaxID=2044917 RepID=UPI000D758021|nr:hypothetical protein [Halomonas sp. LBP4]PXX95861.1 hypothetical protein CR157_16815 [Halomonas sp. LBP4]
MSHESAFGLQCPNCDATDHFEITVEAFASVSGDQVDDLTGGENDWYPASSISCRACRHSGLVCDFDGSRIPGEEVPPFGYGIESNGKMGRDRQWRWYHPAPHGGHGNWCSTDIEACIDAHGNADWPCRTTD